MDKLPLNNNPLELTLLPKELDDLRHDIAEILVLRGKIREESGITDLEGNVLHSFRYPLPEELVREVFLKDEAPTTVGECYIEYIPEFILGEPDDDPKQKTKHQGKVFMLVEYSSSRGEGLSPLNTALTWSIGGYLNNKVPEGFYNSEESIDGKTETMSGVDYSVYDLESMGEGERHDVFARILGDRMALERSLNLDDQQKMREVLKYVASAPPLLD